jgi:hypothetical protein
MMGFPVRRVSFATVGTPAPLEAVNALVSASVIVVIAMKRTAVGVFYTVVARSGQTMWPLCGRSAFSGKECFCCRINIYDTTIHT